MVGNIMTKRDPGADVMHECLHANCLWMSNPSPAAKCPNCHTLKQYTGETCHRNHMTMTPQDLEHYPACRTPSGPPGHVTLSPDVLLPHQPLLLYTIIPYVLTQTAAQLHTAINNAHHRTSYHCLMLLMSLSFIMSSTRNCSVLCNNVNVTSPHIPIHNPIHTIPSNVSLMFIERLFHKYGGAAGDEEVMTFEGFEHLLQSLGIGNVRIEGHALADHFDSDGNRFLNLHPNHDHSNWTSEDGTSSHEDHPHDSDDALHVHAKEQDNQKKQPYDEEHNDVTDNSVDHELHGFHDDDDFSIDLDSTTRRQEDVPQTEDELAFPNTQQEHSVDDHDLETETGMETRAYRQRRAPALPANDKKCYTAAEILSAYHIRYQAGIDKESFVDLCPAIVFQIDEHLCKNPVPHQHVHDRVAPCDSELDAHSHPEVDVHNETLHSEHIGLLEFWKIPGKTWGYAFLSITVISLVGLFSVALVPVMQRIFYDHLIQFLVALAVGSLTGDALLHLIPHSMIPGGHDHDSAESADSIGESGEKAAVYKGLVVLAGIYFFLVAERMMTILGDWKRQKKAKRKRRGLFRAGIGERLHHYSTDHDSSDNIVSALQSESSRDNSKIEDFQEYELFTESPSTSQGGDSERVHSHRGDSHGGENHGHSHGDGTVPGSVSAIAWMVIMGDGLHNFTDGLAIGAAFANSVTSGLSTSVAVFCHELPHELGDFAVLLKAGMSVRHALMYNMVSSVLAVLGMVMGVMIGNISSASLWIFALAGGMFIYISLVDMLPELQKSLPSKNGSCCTSGSSMLILHICGLSVGMGCMLLIALYEEKIQLGVGDDVL